MFAQWTGIPWDGVVLASHEVRKAGPILLIIALIIFTGLTAIMIFLRREGRERRKRMQEQEQQAQPGEAAPDQPAGS